MLKGCLQQAHLECIFGPWLQNNRRRLLEGSPRPFSGRGDKMPSGSLQMAHFEHVRGRGPKMLKVSILGISGAEFRAVAAKLRQETLSRLTLSVFWATARKCLK